VKIFLSGGLDEYQIIKYNAFADGYGVGTAISNAPVIDFSMDIIELNGQPIAKRGKQSGSKSVFRCKGCLETTVMPFGKDPPPCRCKGKKEEILRPFLSKDETPPPLPRPKDIRSFVIKQLEKLAL
jgi:nicotinate phosphoribosyltransferase